MIFASVNQFLSALFLSVGSYYLVKGWKRSPFTLYGVVGVFLGWMIIPACQKALGAPITMTLAGLFLASLCGWVVLINKKKYALVYRILELVMALISSATGVFLLVAGQWHIIWMILIAATLIGGGGVLAIRSSIAISLIIPVSARK